MAEKTNKTLVTFYDNTNYLPMVRIILRDCENKVFADINNLQLKTLPQISYSVKWETGGGAVLAEKLSEFANPLALKFLAGNKYETPAPNGKWTARTVKGSDHITMSLEIRIYSSGAYGSNVNGRIEPPRGAKLQTEIDNILAGLLRCVYFKQYRLKQSVENAKRIIDEGSMLDGNTTVDAAKDFMGHAKDAALSGLKLAKASFESVDSTQQRGENVGNARKDFTTQMKQLGADADKLVKVASKPGMKVTGGIPLARVSFSNSLYDNTFTETDFYVQSLSIKPSVQLINNRALYYDITVGLISRELVTRDMLNEDIRNINK